MAIFVQSPRGTSGRAILYMSTCVEQDTAMILAPSRLRFLEFVGGLFCVTEQRGAAECPVIRVNGLAIPSRARFQVDHCDVLEVCSSRLLVDRALVELGVTTSRRVDRVQMDQRQRSVQHLGLLLAETRVALVPSSAVDKESIYVDSLLGRGADFLRSLDLGDVVGHHNHVERPPLVRPGDLLPHSSDEPSGVEEPGHPECGGSAIKAPGVELGLTVDELGEPKPEGCRQPRNVLPLIRNTGVVHVVERIGELVRHDNGPVDGQKQLFECESNSRYDKLHPLNLLPKENVQWSKVPHRLEPCVVLVLDKVGRELREEVLGHSGDGLFAGLVATTARVLGLNVEDGGQGCPGHLGLTRNVSVGVQAKHAWSVDRRQIFEKLSVLLNLWEVPHRVPLGELKRWIEHAV
eukprot:m.191317 g.191317  ORF g.191317 m.191317 type:complete len:406 (+) comp24916_c0_seq3:48-1265(+)